jgi:hypothetical protein
MYHFVSLDAEGLAQRRRLLDLYANVAQWSASAPLVAVQIVSLVQYLQRKYFANSAQRVARSQDETASSASLSRKHDGKIESNNRGRSAKAAWNAFMWWSGEEAQWAESSRGALLAAACWAIWLLVLSLAQTGDGESDAIWSLPSQRKVISDVRVCQIIFTSPNVSVSSRRHRCHCTICSL